LSRHNPEVRFFRENQPFPRSWIDNYEWNTANGARLSMYACNGLAAQLWRRG